MGEGILINVEVYVNILNASMLREAAECCEASRKSELALHLRQAARDMEVEEAELTAPFDISEELKARIIEWMSTNQTATACVELRKVTGRSIRACYRYVRELRMPV